jgi:ACS family tartrate transporter-like MFS transporter
VSLEDRAFAKAAWRLIPFMGLLYVTSFLDRVNVGFAALTMNRDLGLDATAYGLGAGIFFVGYFLFEVPSNVILERVGARVWIFRIMFSWGVVSMATAFVHERTGFYVLRFLLGSAEAGFFPGMVLYLTYWFPQETRARYIAQFLAAVPLASAIGGPLSSYILTFDGFHGLHGWQWLFVIEGLPSCVLAFAVLWLLPDRPERAGFLSDEEKSTIIAYVSQNAPPHRNLWAGLRDARIWLLSIADFGIVTGLYGIGLWIPQMVRAMGFSNFETGFVVTIPFLASMVGMVLWGYSSDRFRERTWHVAVAALLAAGGLSVAALSHNTTESLLALSVAAIGIYSALSTFWALPTSFLGGTAAAGGIALINSISNLGGFFGPTIMGWLRDRTGGYTAGMAVLSASLVVSAVVILMLGRYLSFEARAHLFDRYAPPT